MSKLVLALVVVVLGVGLLVAAEETPCMGCPKTTDAASPQVKGAAEYALDSIATTAGLDKGSVSLVRVVDAKTQVSFGLACFSLPLVSLSLSFVSLFLSLSRLFLFLSLSACVCLFLSWCFSVFRCMFASLLGFTKEEALLF